VAPPELRTRAVVGHDRAGRPLTETLVTLGPAGIFGIATTGERPSDGAPTAVFLNVANEHHVGPNRLWVELAREWAARGLPAVRIDFTGLGESPARPGRPEEVFRSVVAFDDVLDVARAVSPDDPGNVALVGLCSSAYQAIESGLELAPRGVYAINPVISFTPPEMAEGHPLDPRRRACMPRTALVEAFHGSSLMRRLGGAAWRARHLVSRRGRVADWLDGLVDRGVDCVFICGEGEAQPFLQSPHLERHRRDGRVRLEVLPGLDHGLLNARLRQQSRDLLTDHVEARFTAAGPEPDGDEPPASVGAVG
jgi:hypothetical protein